MSKSRVIRWGEPDTPPPKRPFRDSLIMYALFAAIIVGVAWLTGGVVVVEYVFQFPGLGLGLANAVASRDQPTVEAIAMLITALYVVANLMADIGVIALNPRLRRQP